MTFLKKWHPNKGRERTIPFFVCLVFGGLMGAIFPAQSAVEVLHNADLDSWEEKVFVGQTQYQAIVQEQGQSILQALSDESASGYFRKIQVDLKETPVLRWRWRVERLYDNQDEQSKPGDDFPARIYVVAPHPTWPWKKLALCYVWSSTQPTGTNWPNPYTDELWMIAVQGGGQSLGRWVSEERDVRKDFARYLGQEIDTVQAVGIMTDADNLKTLAETYYGNISFNAQ